MTASVSLLGHVSFKFNKRLVRVLRNAGDDELTIVVGSLIRRLADDSLQ